MPITPLPTPPSRQDPANFANRADAFLGALPTFAAEANALQADVNDKQQAAANSATAAANSAANAYNSQLVAAGASNYKGEWSTLTGALSVPASVSHNGSLWVLKVNLANVSTSQPGVSSDWLQISKPQPTGDVVGTTDSQTLTNKTLTSPIINTPTINTPVTTENVQVVSTNTTAVRSITYVLTASITLTLPSTPSVGDWISVVNRSDTTTPVIARNNQNIMGLAEDMTLDVNFASIKLVYADATSGWVFT